MITFEALTLVLCLIGFIALVAAGLAATFLIGRYGGRPNGRRSRHS